MLVEKKHAAALLIMFFIFAFSFTVHAYTPYFNDINEHWAEDDIETLRKLGTFDGEDFNVSPSKAMTRGEFVSVIAKAMLDCDAGEYKTYFSDVPADHIYSPYISAAFEHGIITGADENRFFPDKLITREETAIILSNLDIIPNSDTNIKFSDIDEKYTYISSVKNLVGWGIIKVGENDSFSPNKEVCRAEGLSMIARTLKCAGTNASPDKLCQFTDKLLKSDYSDDLEFITENSIGQAREDLLYRSALRQRTAAGNIKRTIMPCSGKITFSSGVLSTVRYDSDITFENGDITKEYGITVEYDLIYKDGKYLLYNINTNLYEDYTINMAWCSVSSSMPETTPVGITHLSPTAYVIAKQEDKGSAVNIGADVKLYNRFSDEYLNKIESDEYDIWPMYKNDFTPESAAAFLSNDNARKNAVAYMMDQCIENSFTGINFDFEYMNASDSQAYANHVREFAVAMHDIGVAVSVDIQARNKDEKAQWSVYDRDKLGKYADYTIVMGYSHHYSKSENPGPGAEIPWVEEVINFTLKEVPAEKLILGIPFYTKHWQTENGKIVSAIDILMKDTSEILSDKNAKIEYLPNDQQYRAWWKEDGRDNYIWIEDADTTANRVKLAKQYALSGIALWRWGQETQDVWFAINNILK